MAQILRQVQQRANEGNPLWVDDEKAIVEQALGRPLTLNEEVTGVLDKRGQFAVRDELRGNGFRVKMAGDDPEEDDMLTRRVRELEEQIEKENLAKLSPAEQELAMIKKAQLEGAKNAEVERLQEIEMNQRAPLIEQLSAIVNKMRSMPNTFSRADLLDAEGALLQLETPGSDAAESGRMLARTITRHDQAIAEAAADADQQLAAMTKRFTGWKERHGIMKSEAPQQRLGTPSGWSVTPEQLDAIDPDWRSKNVVGRDR